MALARWQRTIVDEAGNILPGAELTIRQEAPGAPLAALYSDRDGTVLLGNPFNADSNGFAAFHVAGGSYRITATSGLYSQTWDYVGIGLGAESDGQGDIVGPAGGVADDELVLFADDTGKLAKGSGVLAGDVVKRNATANLTAGYTADAFDAGTQTAGTFTPDPANGNFQTVVNGGAHELAPPAANCTMVIQCTNNASAGAITTTGFTLADGDTIGTGDGDDFLFYITKVGAFSYLNVKALQ